MDANELKSRLTLENTIELLEYYGAELRNENEEYYVFSSFCHESNTSKVHLYKSTNTIYCFVCSHMDVISIVQEQEGLEFQEAIDWLTNFFGLNKKHTFGRPKKIEHKPREIKKKEIDVNEKLPQYNESILNTFYDIPIIEWLNEGISKETMDIFGIKFDINTNAIIIPHRDIDGRLIGIRCRNLSEDKIEQYGKYLPYTDIFSDITYKHKITMNLYGLYENKDNIAKKKTAILFESEKSTELMNSYYPDDSISVSLGCSSISDFQIELLKSLGVETVIVCFDYEIREKLLKKFEKNYKKCALHFNTYVLDNDLMGQLLEESDSPIDKGKEIFEQLLWNKIKYELEV